MIEPRCLNKADGRSRLLRDDFALWENGFIGLALATHSQARSTGKPTRPGAAGRAGGLPTVVGGLRSRDQGRSRYSADARAPAGFLIGA
jgi:hypothetical protein